MKNLMLAVLLGGLTASLLPAQPGPKPTTLPGPPGLIAFDLIRHAEDAEMRGDVLTSFAYVDKALEVGRDLPAPMAAECLRSAMALLLKVQIKSIRHRQFDINAHAHARVSYIIDTLGQLDPRDREGPLDPYEPLPEFPFVPIEEGGPDPTQAPPDDPWPLPPSKYGAFDEEKALKKIAGNEVLIALQKTPPALPEGLVGSPPGSGQRMAESVLGEIERHTFGPFADVLGSNQHAPHLDLVRNQRPLPPPGPEPPPPPPLDDDWEPGQPFYSDFESTPAARPNLDRIPPRLPDPARVQIRPWEPPPPPKPLPYEPRYQPPQPEEDDLRHLLDERQRVLNEHLSAMNRGDRHAAQRFLLDYQYLSQAIVERKRKVLELSRRRR